MARGWPVSEGVEGLAAAIDALVQIVDMFDTRERDALTAVQFEDQRPRLGNDLDLVDSIPGDVSAHGPVRLDDQRIGLDQDGSTEDRPKPHKGDTDAGDRDRRPHHRVACPDTTGEKEDAQAVDGDPQKPAEGTSPKPVPLDIHRTSLAAQR